jgi:AraC-like DNA-binding protein
MALTEHVQCHKSFQPCPIVFAIVDDVDVLSDVITAMRTGQPHSARTVGHAATAARFEPVAGIGFHIVLQGSSWVTTADRIQLGVGDVVCVLPQAGEYSLVTEPNTVLLCGAYLLDQSRAHPLLAELPALIHLPARVGGHPSLRSAIDLLGTELEQRRQGADAIVPALLDMLLLYILRAWYDEQPADGWSAALSDPAVSAALRAIHDDPGRAWTVEELGAQGGLSRAAFARRFNALIGQPPLGYLTWWRMTTAARLLRDTDIPLRAIASRTGYASEFAFAKAFKREYGTAPGAFRRSPGDGQRLHAVHD